MHLHLAQMEYQVRKVVFPQGIVHLVLLVKLDQTPNELGMIAQASANAIVGRQHKAVQPGVQLGGQPFGVRGEEMTGARNAPARKDLASERRIGEVKNEAAAWIPFEQLLERDGGFDQ